MARREQLSSVAFVALVLLLVAVTHRAGILPGGHFATDALFVLLGAAVARSAGVDDMPSTSTWLLRHVAAPALAVLLVLALYATTAADAAEHSLLRGGTAWGLLGVADQHAAVSGAPEVAAASGAAPAAAGHLWALSAGLRFAVLWFALTRLSRARSLARSTGDMAATASRRLLLFVAAGGLLLVTTLGALHAHATDELGRVLTSPASRSAGLLLGATTALLPSASRQNVARRISRAGGPMAPLAVLALIVVVAPSEPLAVHIAALLSALAGAALLIVLEVHAWDGAARVLRRLTPPGMPVGPLVFGITAYALHGPVLAMAQHADLPRVLGLLVTILGASALAFAVVMLAALLVPTRSRAEDTAVWLCPAAVLTVLLLFIATGAFAFEKPRWAPGFGPPQTDTVPVGGS